MGKAKKRGRRQPAPVLALAGMWDRLEVCDDEQALLPEICDAIVQCEQRIELDLDT